MKLFEQTDRGFVPTGTPEGFVPDLASYDLILLNTSGGKDSQAMMDHVIALARIAAVPRKRLIAVHADLGEMDWPETMPTVERHARAYGLRLEVVSREKGGLLSHVEARGMWPDAARRYCTSDHKAGPSNKQLTRLVEEIRAERMIPRGALLKRLGIKPIRILNVFGMRAHESAARRKRPVFERQANISSGNRTVDRWLAIHGWTLAEVWTRIRNSGIEPHPIYKEGLSRSSCSFCVLASKADLVNAARLRPELAARYAELEHRIGHRFRNDLSMAEIIELAKTPPDKGAR